MIFSLYLFSQINSIIDDCQGSRYASAYCNGSLPFKRQPRKMVKHAQTNCLGVFDHFVGLVLKGLIK